MLRPIAFAAFVVATPAFAMNWEGKEDWMAEIPHAQAYEEQLPPATPRTTRTCDPVPSANPYEQVPIPGKNCRPAAAQGDPKR